MVRESTDGVERESEEIREGECRWSWGEQRGVSRGEMRL